MLAIASKPINNKYFYTVSENEISFKLEIPSLTYNNLMCLIEKLNYIELTKLNYSKPEGFRIIYGKNYNIKQIKTQKNYKEDFLIYKNKFIFQTIITKCTEELISNTSVYENENNLESSIQRHYIYIDQNKKLRVSIEKKFSSKYTMTKEQETTKETQEQVSKTKPAVIAIDKWVRLASQTYLHVEYEFNEHQDIMSVKQELLDHLESSQLFNKIMYHIMMVCENISLNTLLESKLDIIPRKFTTTLYQQPIKISQKLDGIRATCIIHQNKIIIDNSDEMNIPVKIVQPIKCHVEKMKDGYYYIIDILEIWGPKNIYIKPDHIQAIELIKSDFIQQIVGSKLLTNNFYSPGINLPKTNVKNDGLLMFTKNNIVKYKEHTIDLILKKPMVKNEKNKSKKEKFGNYYSKTVSELNEQRQSDIADLLFFADQKKFCDWCSGWTVDIELTLDDLFNDNYSNEDTNMEQNISNTSIRNFIILEFKVDSINKCIIFLKKRKDKMQANTYQAMTQMINY